MNLFEDPSLKLSYFNSVFQLLATFNFAYAGLQHLMGKMIDSYLRKELKDHQDEALLASTQVSLMLSQGDEPGQREDEEDLRSLIDEVTGRYNKYFTDPDLFHKKSKLKFIPGFIFCGFYCFFILILAALAESHRVISFGHSAVNWGFQVSYSIQHYGYVILLFYNLLCTAFIYHLFTRPRSLEILVEPEGFDEIKFNFYRATQFFVFSVIVSAFVCWFTDAIPPDSLLFQLSLVFWSLVLCVAPLLSFIVWVFAVHRVKFSVQGDVIREVSLFLRYKLRGKPNKFIRVTEDIENHRRIGRSKYLRSTNRERTLKWLRTIKFAKLYGLKLIAIAASSVLFLGLVNILLEKEESHHVSLIRRATRREFEAYKRLPRIDTTWYDEYFVKGSELRRKITERLEYHRNNAEIITNPGNPSDFEFIDGREVYIDSDRLIIETNEYWDMKWFNYKTKKYSYHYSYDVTSPQQYIFKKINGRWLADKNSNMGKIQYLE